MENEVEGLGSSPNTSLPTIIACGKYFDVVNINGDKIQTKCKHCNKTSSCSFKSASNLLKHLIKDHPDLQAEYRNLEKQKRGRKRLSDKPPNSDQPTLPFKVSKVLPANYSEAEKQKQLIVNYIVNSIRPLTTIREKSFKELVNGLQDKPLDAPITSYEDIVKEIGRRVDDMRSKIADIVSKNQFFCMTADAWTGGTRSFLGVTLHWIGNGESGELRRNSAVIALPRFNGSHTYDRIKNILLKVMNTYGLTKNKVVGVVTDGGSNFCKAFRMYGSDWKTYDLHALEGLDADDLELEQTDEIKIVSLDNLEFNTNMEDDKDHELPFHFRCSAHNLSNVAKALAKVPQDTGGIQGTLKRAIDNASSYWDLSSYPSRQEVVNEVCNGLSFVKPNETRWNSLFDALKRFLRLKGNLTQIKQRLPDLNLPQMSNDQLEALEEYVVLLKPLAKALDTLQATDIFMGEFLPTIRRLYTKASDCEVRRLQRVRDAYIEQLRERFNVEIQMTSECDNSILAAVSHPAHKTEWVPKEEEQRVQNLILEAMKAEAFKDKTAERDNDPVPQSAKQDKRKEFLGYSKTISAPVQTEATLKVELRQYLADNEEEIRILDKYKTVKKVFMRYNTLMPSQASSERLFSYGGLILRPDRRSLTDENVEALALLKCNADIL